YYAFLVRQAGGTELTPAEVHALGLKEVARIRLASRLSALAGNRRLSLRAKARNCGSVPWNPVRLTASSMARRMRATSF
ncbi:MAG TPA: hypothetical protein DDZ22_07545, partial [Massilia sp.]|nr:hypothetical protein [Massilia sp.]